MLLAIRGTSKDNANVCAAGKRFQKSFGFQEVEYIHARSNHGYTARLFVPRWDFTLMQFSNNPRTLKEEKVKTSYEDRHGCLP
jgi:hypothetical protein